MNYCIAEPEKAVIDYVYLNPSINSVTDAASLRWNRLRLKKIIDTDRLDSYVHYINNNALRERIEIIKEVYFAST